MIIMNIFLFGYYVNGTTDYGMLNFGFAPTLSEMDKEYIQWCKEIEDDD